MSNLVNKLRKHEIWLLRLAVAFPMIWAGVGGIFNPRAWIGYVPDAVEILVTRELFLVFHSYLLIIWAIMILFGPMRWFVALLAFLNLVVILFFFGLDDITFRDVGLALVALALVIREKPE